MADSISNLQRMDACRPHCDDLKAPEMAELAAVLEGHPELRAQLERSRRFDAAVIAACHDVAVPAGLADRLLAAVCRQAPIHPETVDVGTNQQDASERTPDDPATSTNSASNSIRGRNRNRVRWGVALGTALTLVLAASFWWNSSRNSMVTEAQLDAATREWLSQLSPDHNFRVLQEDVLRGFPSDHRVTFWPLVWQPVETNIGEALVYEDLDRSQRAFMFVIRTSGRTGLPGAPPTSCSDTAGWCIGSWQVGDRVYVLAVEGDKDRYRRYVPPPDVA